jgi:hypothetical protein
VEKVLIARTHKAVRYRTVSASDSEPLFLTLFKDPYKTAKPLLLEAVESYTTRGNASTAKPG